MHLRLSMTNPKVCIEVRFRRPEPERERGSWKTLAHRSGSDGDGVINPGRVAELPQHRLLASAPPATPPPPPDPPPPPPPPAPPPPPTPRPPRPPPRAPAPQTPPEPPTTDVGRRRHSPHPTPPPPAAPLDHPRGRTHPRQAPHRALRRPPPRRRAPSPPPQPPPHPPLRPRARRPALPVPSRSRCVEIYYFPIHIAFGEIHVQQSPLFVARLQVGHLVRSSSPGCRTGPCPAGRASRPP